ncbi:MAG: DUF4347 domain-containing protein, partial [Burkholderiales bacterium]|nr:DUF4347 domain-containing protein [Burkholderiales bacterium]
MLALPARPNRPGAAFSSSLALAAALGKRRGAVAEAGSVEPSRERCRQGRAPYARKALIEALEGRLLYSGDGVPIELPEHGAVEGQIYLAESAGPVIDLSRRLADAPLPDTAANRARAAADPLAPPAPVRRELVVVDAAIAEREQLVAELAAQAGSARSFEILLLDSATDGLAQITQALFARGIVFDAMHVFSHGAQDALVLGSSRIGFAAPNARPEAVREWERYLAEDADLLLYACDIAALDAGTQWLAWLAQASGADVAASRDLTANAALGGDWDLEWRAGAIEARTLAAPGLSGTLAANQATAGTQSAPSAGVDAGGNSVLVWQSDGQDGSGWGVYGRRFDASGAPLGAEFRVATTAAGDQHTPDIVVEQDGDFVVVWTGQGQDGDGGHEGNVYARCFAADGTALGAEFRVNTTTLGDQSAAALALDGDGFMVTWQSAGQDGSGLGVYARRYDGGNPNGGEFPINTTTALDQGAPDVAGDRHGNFVFVWQSQNQDGSGWGIYRTYLKHNGNFEGGEQLVNSTVLGDQVDPAVAFDDNHDWLIAWTSQGQDGSGGGIYADFLRYTGGGGNGSGEFRVNTTVAGDQSQVAIARGDERDFLLAWTSLGQDNDGAGEGNVYARLLERSGAAVAPLGAEFRLNAFDTGSQQAAALALNEDGKAIAVWQGATAEDANGIALRSFAVAFGDNHAPVLTGANALVSIAEDAFGNNGTLVAALIGGHWSDADAAATA